MKKIILILIISILFTSCSNNQETKIQKNYKISIVSSGTINLNTSYIGYTRGVEQVNLATKSSGRITYMSKNLGDKVTFGELIATIDSNEAKTGYDTANNIANSLISLKSGTSDVIDEQIKSLEAKIDGIVLTVKGVETGLIDIKKITSSQIETAKIGVETSKINLEKTIKSLNIQKSNIISSSKSSIIGSVILNENIIYFSDSILGVTKENKKLNDSFDGYLGIKNTTHLKETEKIFLETKNIFDEYKLYYENNIEDKSPSDNKIIEGLILAEKLAEKQKILLKDLYKVLDDSIININFSVETINSYKNQISIFGIDIENSLLSMSGDTMIGIKGSIQNINSFDSEYDKAVSLLEKQVELAEKTLEQYKLTSNGEINKIQTQKEIAKSGLEEAYAGLKALKFQKSATLGEIDTKIAETIGAKNLAGVMINNGKIYATFTGIIISKMAEIGQVINAGIPIYQIADTKIIKIDLGVSKNIIEQLKNGDQIDLNIEGLKKIYIGTVTNISSSVNSITKKYEIEITINNTNSEIPVGAMATVSFKEKSLDIDSFEENKEQKIMIPNSAIISKFMIPGVYILEEKKAIFKNIEIINMGEIYSEILGLEIGKTIITEGKENIWDGEELN